MGKFDLFKSKPNVEKMKDRKNIEGLIKALGYGRNSNVRKKAAEALWKIGKSAIEQLVRALNDEDRSVREGVEEAIARLSAKGISPFGEIFERDDVGIDVKRSLMQVLQIIPGALRALDLYSIPPLGIEASDDDTRAKHEHITRTDTIRRLGEIGDPQAVDDLIDALQHSKDNLVRGEAAVALGKIGDERAVEPLIHALTQHPTSLPDKTEYIRIKAAEALCKIRDTRAAEPLIRTLKKDISLDVLRRSEEALVKIGKPAVEPLSQALKDTSVDARSGAARTLGKIGDSKAVSPLIQALKDESFSPYVRTDIVEALGKIGDAGAVEQLIQAIEDEHYDVRRHAAKALGEIGNPRAVEPLIRALKDKSPYVRRDAAVALGNIKDARAVGSLIEALKDEDRGVRYYAEEALEEALVKIGGPSVGPLIEALKDEDSNVRGRAVHALGKIGDKRAVEPLTEALKDEKGSVRWMAAVALGNIGDERAVEPLKVLKNEDEDVREAAEEALEKIKANKS